MKQHITIEQLNELKGWPKRRLKEWCNQRVYDHFLSIGQMIEFLWNHDYQAPSFELLTFDDSTPDLCDVLWEAVKEVLNTA